MHITSDKPTVLVLEDNADQWFMIQWAFHQRFSEVEPIWMAEPTQAMYYLEACLQDGESIPKLILLDIYLPHYEVGLKTLQWLKRHPLVREIPVVILSQSSHLADIKEAYQQGCNCYITKPTNYEHWLDYLTQLRQYWWTIATLPAPVQV